ncbi:ER membrane protein complex subunit 1 [Entamoeba marina]
MKQFCLCLLLFGCLTLCVAKPKFRNTDRFKPRGNDRFKREDNVQYDNTQKPQTTESVPTALELHKRAAEIETQYQAPKREKEHKTMDMFLDKDPNAPVHEVPKIRWSQSTSSRSSVFASLTLADFNHDGRKEVIVPTDSHYIDALDVNTGNKVPGFPVVIEDSGFYASGIRYQEGEIEYTIASAANGFIYFVNKNGFYNESRTIKIPPLYIPANWDDGLDTSDKCIIVNLNKRVITRSISNELYSQTQKINQRLEAIKTRHAARLQDYKYNPEEYANDPFFQLELTPEGQKSLAELFHNAASANDNFDDHINCRHAAIYDNYAGLDGDFKYARLRPHILSTPQLVDLKGGKRLIVPITYYINPSPNVDKAGIKIEKMLDENKYCVSAIAIIDPISGKIDSLTSLDLTVMNTRESAALLSGVEVIGNGGSLSTIIIGNAAGRVHRISLDDGAIIIGNSWPIQVGPIMSKLLVDDVNRDGEIDLITADVNGNVMCFDMLGNLLWEVNVGGPILQEVIPLRIVLETKITLLFIASSDGSIHCLDGKTGDEVDIFPLTVGSSSIVGPIGVVRDGEDITITVSSSSGKLALLEFKMMTSQVMKNLNVIRDLENSQYIVYVGGHSLDIDDVVYTQPLSILRNVDNVVNQDIFKAAKIYKKNGWDKMSWEKRVEENGLVLCVDQKRTRTDVEGTITSRGVHVKNVDVRKDVAVLIVEYEENGEKPHRIVLETSSGEHIDVEQETLKKLELANIVSYAGLSTYNFVIPIPSKPQVLSVAITAYNSHGLKAETSVEFGVHNNFYHNVPEIIIIPFFIFCLAVVYLLSDYWKLSIQFDNSDSGN